MKPTQTRSALHLVALGVALSLAQGCDDAEPAAADAAMEAAVDARAADVVVADSAADALASDASPGDASSGDASSGDGGACPDFTGAWALVGTCTVPGFSPFPSACITQTGCSASITVAPGVLPGTVTDGTLTFMASVSDIPLSCTATRAADGTLDVICDADGLASCTARATRVSVSGSPATCCDVVAQSCGAGQRCNIVSEGAMNASLVTACLAAGTTAEGATCTREGGRLGLDGCGVGLTCVNHGQAAAGDRACQRLCRTSADCTGGASCVVVASTPRAGVCVGACTIQGSDCARGTCRAQPTWAAPGGSGEQAIATACMPTGALAEGATCTSSNDCGAQLSCASATAGGGFACRRTCDTAHACASGQRCNALTGGVNPSGAGFCVPL